MISGLKPYPEYKELKLPWLPQVPKHWEIKRGRSLFNCVDKRSSTGKEELLTVSSARGVVPRNSAKVTMFKAESYLGYKMCWPGDLVINSLWAWAGGLGVSRHHGIISFAYGIYRTRDKEIISPDYLHELVRSSSFNWELHVRSKGIWTSRLLLSDQDFLDAPFPLPSAAEQKAIVKFLNWANGQLERAIRAKRKTIGLLNEQKQAIIHRTITRGLNPNAPMKPSGIPYFGDIPAHWDVKRGKFVFQPIDVMSKNGQEELLTVSSKDGIVLRSSKTVTMFKAASYVGHKLCWPKDLVINSLWAWARGLGFSRHHGIVSTAYGVYRLRENYSDCWEYLNELLRSPAYGWEFHVRSKGIWKSRLQLTDESFLDMCIVLPPNNEAIALVSYIKDATSDIVLSISQLEKQIELLQEYRTRLTADVVTGKLDVRAVASKLPDENLTGEAAMSEAAEEPETEESAI